MFVGDVLFGPAFLYQVILQMPSRSCVMLAFVSGAVQSERGDSDRAVRTQLDSLFEERAKTLRISIRGEPHDFIFVGVEIETEMKCNQGIENPDGILRRNFVELVEFAVMRVIYRGALRFTHAIQNNDQALVPAGGEVGARRVRQMMVYMVYALFRESGQVTRHLREQRFPGERSPIQPGRCSVDRINFAIGPIVKAVRDLVDILEREPRLGQAEPDGFGWEFCAVLLTIEPLLGGGRNGHTVDHQGRGGIMPLRDSVLTFLQARPMSPFERHGVFEPADS